MPQCQSLVGCGHYTWSFRLNIHMTKKIQTIDCLWSVSPVYVWGWGFQELWLCIWNRICIKEFSYNHRCGLLCWQSQTENLWSVGGWYRSSRKFLLRMQIQMTFLRLQPITKSLPTLSTALSGMTIPGLWKWLWNRLSKTSPNPKEMNLSDILSPSDEIILWLTS